MRSEAEKKYGFGPWDKLPHFVGPTVVELDIPSGKIIAADSLRGVDYFDIEPPLSINYGYGCDAWSKESAEKGLGYAFVGNTCPTIVREVGKLDVLEIVTGGWTEEDEKEIPAVQNGQESVGWICTDLWATMLTDYQNWLDHGGPSVDPEDAGKYKTYNLIDVEPGRYRWTVFSHSEGFDTWSQDRQVYARLERIGEIENV